MAQQAVLKSPFRSGLEIVGCVVVLLPPNHNRLECPGHAAVVHPACLLSDGNPANSSVCVKLDLSEEL